MWLVSSAGYWGLLSIPDLDSMTAALTWAYHLSHIEQVNNDSSSTASTPEHPHPTKAIALLQTPQDALDLRPENKLALHNVQMSPGHRDLLTIDELPLPAIQLAKVIKGIVLVDHPVPLSVWSDARIISIFDHHKDRGAGADAHPRIFESTASCTTLVAREMLNELERLPQEYHMPHEVVELILDAIALDSNGLQKATTEDRYTARRLLKRSNWNSQKLLNVMARLSDEMRKAKKDLESLGIRDLLRRDWKGDLTRTKSTQHPNVHLGLASIPYSLDEQIQRTLHEDTQSWFDVEQAWTREIGADISLSLNSYNVRRKGVVEGSRHDDEEDEGDETNDDESNEDNIYDDDNDDDDDDEYKASLRKTKTREICLVVRPSERLSEEAANDLFHTVKKALGESPFLDAEPWHKANELKERQ
jgi:exopolyphosphatase